MKSTAKKQSVYYHITQFGNAAHILKTGKLRGGIIAGYERESHREARIQTRGYYISLARSLSSSYIESRLKVGAPNIFCVLMIDTEKIKSRFRMVPINYANIDRGESEYEERLIFDTEDIDVSNAVVGIVLRATGLKGSLVKIPRRFFPFTRGRDLFYVTGRNPTTKRPLTLKKLELAKKPLEAVTSRPPKKTSLYNFSTAMLTTPIDKVKMLPLTTLALYVWHCSHINSMRSDAYNDKSVYDFIIKQAIRRKVDPEVISNEMYSAGKAALSRHEGNLISDFIALVALATKNTRTKVEKRKSLSAVSDAAIALCDIFKNDPVLALDLRRLREALSFVTIAAYSVEDFVLAYKKYDPNDWYGMDWNGYVEVKLDGLLDEIKSLAGSKVANMLAPHFSAMYSNNNAKAMQILKSRLAAIAASRLVDPRLFSDKVVRKKISDLAKLIVQAHKHFANYMTLAQSYFDEAAKELNYLLTTATYRTGFLSMQQKVRRLLHALEDDFEYAYKKLRIPEQDLNEVAADASSLEYLMQNEPDEPETKAFHDWARLLEFKKKAEEKLQYFDTIQTIQKSVTMESTETLFHASLYASDLAKNGWSAAGDRTGVGSIGKQQTVSFTYSLVYAQQLFQFFIAAWMVANKKMSVDRVAALFKTKRETYHKPMRAGGILDFDTNILAKDKYEAKDQGLNEFLNFVHMHEIGVNYLAIYNADVLYKQLRSIPVTSIGIVKCVVETEGAEHLPGEWEIRVKPEAIQRTVLVTKGSG